MANKNEKDIQTPGTDRITLTDLLQTGGSMRIRDLDNTLWFPPGSPVPPVAPAGTPPRRYAGTPYININFAGRDGQIDFGIIRAFSDYPLVRFIIETIKDKVGTTPWEIQSQQLVGEPKKIYTSRQQQDPRITAVKEFFRKPDGWQPFRQWQRGLLDDMLTIDAAALWLQRDTNQKICNLVQIAGEQVVPLVDETYSQPHDPESVAFQLRPYGYPAMDMANKDMIYAVRNRLSHRRYGFGPVEQAIPYIALGLGRLDFQASWYRSGNIPQGLLFMPPDIPIGKVEEFQGYFDSVLAGNLQKRRQLIALPSYGSDSKPSVIFPKEPLLKDEMDEWLARVLCYCFGVSPTSFIKQVNRATAQNQAEQSIQEGLEPYLVWFEDLMNDIIQVQLGFTDLFFAFGERKEPDEEKQAQIDKVNVSTGIKTVNQVRIDNGDDPYDPALYPDADKPILVTATGYVILDDQDAADAQALELQQNQLDAKNKSAEPGSDQDGGDDNNNNGGQGKPKNKPKPKPKGKPDGKPKPQKAASFPSFAADKLSARSVAARGQAERAIKKTFRNIHEKLISSLKKAFKTFDPMNYGYGQKLRKDDLEDFWDYMQREFLGLVPDMSQALEDAAISGISNGIVSLGADDPSLLASANIIAADWARNRAAEMVGMRRDVDGNLIPNPDAQWVISDTTRDKIREIVTNSFEQQQPLDTVIQDIQDSGAFSDDRAALIASTEIGRAQSGGTLDVWKRTGLVNKVRWDCMGDDPCEFCEPNDGVEVEFGQPFPGGQFSTLDSHPNCYCLLTAVGITNPDEQ